MLERSQADETVGDRLKRLRLERGLSQRDLAVPGVSYAYISRIEAGTRQPSVKALRKLAAKLNVTAEFLEHGSDLASSEERELRLANLELANRLEQSADFEVQLTAVLEEALRAGDPAVAARAHLALALACDERGNHALAVKHFEAACALERPSAAERVGVYVTIGRAYGALGEARREIALYESCIDELRRLGAEATSAMSRYRIRLSYALSDVGDFKGAQLALREALRKDTGPDRYMRIRVFWSLARLAEMEGRSKLALRYARRAIALLEETEDVLQRARAHLLAAWILNSDEDAERASEQLHEAERILAEGAPSDDLATLAVEKARTETLRGNGTVAIALALDAIAMLTNQNGPLLGTAYWALAAGHALEADIESAGKAYEQSLKLLEQNHRWREANKASRDWAQMLRAAGHTTEALDVLERSVEYANRLPQPAAEAARAHDA